MSANKRKILENAQKYLQRGQLDKALKEFQAALQADPRDTGTRLKIGDLHLKQGNKDEAVGAYLKVADQFMKDGFDARAVALYKQILKIDAARADVNIPLAELYTRLGLTSDAMASLQTAADAYHREGRKRDALELLRKMARLDPTNVTSRLKIAELLQQAGMKEEALLELDEVAREVERIADADEMKRVYERLIELDPSRHAAHVGLGRIALGRADFGAAEEHARQALELQPEAAEGLELIADMLRESGREDELEPIYRRLADVYRGRGDEDRARAILQRHVTSEGLAQGDEPAFGAPGELDGGASPFGALDEADLGAGSALSEDELVLDDDSDLAGAPLSAAATAPPAASATSQAAVTAPPAAKASPAPPPPGDPDQLVAEANVYLRYGKIDKAISSLESALAAAPDHRGALTKLAEVMEQRGELDRAAALRARTGAATPVALQKPVAPPSPVAPRSAALEADEDLGELTFSRSSDEASASAATSAQHDPEVSAPLELNIDIDLELGLGDSDGADDAAGSDALDVDALAPGPASANESGSSTSTAVQIIEELEEAEFYFHQSLFEEAEAVYRRVLTLAPNHPQAMLRLGEIEAARGNEPGASRPAITAAPPSPPGEATIAFAKTGPAPSDDAGSFDLAGQLDVDDESDGLGDPTTAPPGEDSSTQPSVISPGLEPEGAFALDLDDTTADSSPPARAPSASSSGFQGLATTRPVALDAPSIALETEAAEAETGPAEASVEDALAAAMADAQPVATPLVAAAQPVPEPIVAAAQPVATPRAVVPATDTAETLPAPSAGGEEFDLAAELSEAFAEANRPADSGGIAEERFDEGFHAVFDAFKRGVKRVVEAGDHETHFDLGIAYREMGLLDDAIGEFAQAVGAPARGLAALHMMGLCALDLKRPADAVAHLEQALSLPDVPSDQACALHCDLARAFVALGNAQRARAALERVSALDAAFPELEKRRAELDALEEGEPPGEPAEPFESFDDLIAEAGTDEPEPPGEMEPAALSLASEELERPSPASVGDATTDPALPAATTATETPAPPAPSPARKRKISFL